MSFHKESEFEDALVSLLVNKKGWKAGVLTYQTEEDLIENWAKILFEIIAELTS